MKFLTALGQFFWPWLERPSADDLKKQEGRSKADRARIEALDLRQDADVALEEARRMADSEAERRRGTDQKAATYLPLVAALVPLVLTIVSAFWEKKAGAAPGWLNMPLLGLAVGYIAMAGIWAFRVLEVGVSHEAGLGDFELAWRKPRPAAAFVRRILLYTRLNQDRINWKVSCIKMAHAFLLRAFVTFSAILILNIGWYLVVLTIQKIPAGSGREFVASQHAIFATSQVDHMADRLKTIESWTIFGQLCQGHSGNGRKLTLTPSALTPMRSAPTMLNASPNDRSVYRTIRMDCGDRNVGVIRAWYLPHRLEKRGATSILPAPLTSSTLASIVAVEQDWPSIKLADISTTLPSILIRQSVILRGKDAQPSALIVTHVGSGVLALDPSRR